MEILKKYDRWNWERVSRHLAYWLLWGIFFVTVNKLTEEEHDLWRWIAFEGVVLPIKISSTYIIAYALMPRFLYRKRYVTFGLSTMLVALFFAALLYGLYASLINPVIMEYPEHYPVAEFLYKGVDLVYIASFVLGIKFFQNHLHEQARSQAIFQQKVEAELKYLRNQIQPHFLFNTLNNIYGMILSNDPHAADYVVRLSDLLSYILYESDRETIALSKEIEILDSYIELERLRYDRKLDFHYTKTNISGPLSIAPLLLVPFVENAFKHGPAKEEKQSFMDIQLEVQHEILYFSVENSYSSQVVTPKIQSGIGLKNIQKRLALLYSDKYTLTITQEETFKVALMIDLRD